MHAWMHGISAVVFGFRRAAATGGGGKFSYILARIIQLEMELETTETRKLETRKKLILIY